MSYVKETKLKQIRCTLSILFVVKTNSSFWFYLMWPAQKQFDGYVFCSNPNLIDQITFLKIVINTFLKPFFS